MLSDRTFFPVELIATVGDSTDISTLSPPTDWREELNAYRAERETRSLMMNHTGCCG